MERDIPDEIRTAAEVARRGLALLCVIAVAFGANREDIIEWLSDSGLSDELSPSETSFIHDPAPSRRQVVNAGWYSERLIVLAWALGLARLPPANQQCDTAVFLEILPPYAEVEVGEFIKNAQLRPDEELIDAADSILNLHWEARDADIHDRQTRLEVDLEIIQERHHAINWIIGYDGLPWDEVTTDT